MPQEEDLIKCPICSELVHPKAAQCKHCGNKLKMRMAAHAAREQITKLKSKRKAIYKGSLIIFSIAALIFGGILLTNYIKQEKRKAAIQEEKRIERGYSISELKSHISISKQDFKHTYYTYTTDTYVKTDYYSGFSESRLKGGEKKSELQGVIIRGKLKNDLSQTRIKVKLLISFETEEYETDGYDCNHEYFPPKSFSKTVIVNVSPDSYTYFEKYFYTEVIGRHGGRGICLSLFGGSFKRSTHLDPSTLQLEILSVERI